MPAEEYPILFDETFPVTWDAACASGCLSPTGLFNMIQLTAGNHADLCRFGFYHMRAAGQAWVLNRMKVRFERMPRCGQHVRVTTWIHASNGILSERHMQLEHQGDIFARASTLWVCIDYRKRTPQHIAAAYPDYLVRNERSCGLSRPRRIPLPEAADVLRSYRVAYSDIDAMGHVNNTKYTQWILDSLPFPLAVGLKSGEIEANFLSELHQGDPVTIEQGVPGKEREGNGALFVVRRETDRQPVFVAKYAPISRNSRK